MDIFGIIFGKPALIGLHLGFAIVGIDAFLWLLGEMISGTKGEAALLRHRIAAAIGTAGFIASWIFGGFYYVTFYGSSVKPIIQGGSAPWAHAIFMEAKEHIFLFLVPMALTILFMVLHRDETEPGVFKKSGTILVGLVAVLGLLIGLMGFIISAAARWGAIPQ